MKKYITILLLSVFTSCVNIDVTPENAVTFENFFKTENDIQIFMNTIKHQYRACIVQGINFNYAIQNGFYAEKVRDSGIKNRRALKTGMFGFSANSTHSDWYEYYSIITECNILFEKIDGAEISQEKKDSYIGQTYFYRAHAYFVIAQNWGDAPIELNSRDTKIKSKSPFSVVLQQSIDDFEESIERLPEFKNLTDENGQSTTRRDLLCKESCYAILSYVYAWKASLNNEPALYKTAISYLDKVLTQTQYYDLASNPEEICTELLRGKNHKESILEVANGWNDGGFLNQSTPAYYVTGFPIAPTKKEGDIKTEKAQISNASVDKMFPKGDLRRESYFYKTDSYRDEESLIISGGWAYPYKFRYPLLELEGTAMGNVRLLSEARVMYRVADLLLLRAECYVRTSDNDNAIADLNRVRARSNATLYGVNSEPGDLRYTIFKEREKELLWECHRYFDIIRNGYYSEISPEFGALTEQQIKDGAIYAPVNSSSFMNNPLMIQNIYWASRF